MAPGSPWENDYYESFNSKLRDELLAAEQFSTLHKAKELIERSAIASAPETILQRSKVHNNARIERSHAIC